MLYQPSTLAVAVFFAFVGVTLGLSFWLGRKAKSSAGYFAAHGEILGSSTASRSPAITFRRRRSSASAG
jgi:Na+(H+)/acetate symporter ActP